jgi:GT2 family glycosyltransferase
MTVPVPIAPVAGPHPELSVMIPTWQPEPEYLVGAVGSVLAEVADDDAVEIVIVDDASPDFDPHAFVRRFPPCRVAVRRHETHRGLAGNWNACLTAARGRWVHLLHQDDFVLPGFYAALRRGLALDPHIAAAFCASYLSDADGRGWAPRLVPMTAPGILADWQRHVFERLSIQCSAILVRRDVYETLGGFDPDFSYALDWDMWRRIAARYPLWYHPEPLASYRMHAGSETARQQTDGRHLVEIFRSIERSAHLLPPGDAPRVLRRARFHCAVFAVENALAVLRSAGFAPARRQLDAARRGSSLPALAMAVVAVAVRGSVRALSRRR